MWTGGNHFGPLSNSFCCNGTVRAELITEFILKRAGPVIFKTFFSGIRSFQSDSSNWSLKITETIINSRQGLSRNKISKNGEIISWKNFYGSAIMLVPTVILFREWTKAPGSESAARICPRKSPPKRGLWESYFLQGIIGKTHTQNLQILREDTLGATCSAGPFCLLPTFFVAMVFRGLYQAIRVATLGWFRSCWLSCLSVPVWCWCPGFRASSRASDLCALGLAFASCPLNVFETPVCDPPTGNFSEAPLKENPYPPPKKFGGWRFHPPNLESERQKTL